MKSGTNQITVHFGCPCGMHYTATQVELLAQRQGRFRCTDCGKVVHEWHGKHHYFDWRAMIMPRVRTGQRLQ